MTDIIKTARKTNLDTTLLRTLVAISDYGGFSEAAQALHLTQSAVSHHVRRHEEQLGNAFLRPLGVEGVLQRQVNSFHGTQGKWLWPVLSNHISLDYEPSDLTVCLDR